MSPAGSLKLGALLFVAAAAAALMSIALADNITTTTTPGTTTRRQVTAGITATSSSSSLTSTTTQATAHPTSTTQIPAETTTTRSRSSTNPEITTAATSNAPTTTATTTSPIANQSSFSTVKVTTVMLPQQEKLVGLPINNSTSSDSSPESSTENQFSSSESPTPIVSVATTTTTQMSFMQLGKNVGVSKSKNELIPGGKPAHKVNSVNQGYFGGKLGSVLGKYSPYFEDGQEEVNVTARIGSTVMLDCVIGMLGNRTVTWSYRSHDVFRLLTVGRAAYSVDARISLHFKYPTNWRLRIQYATPRDSGLYECQVATDPPPLVKRIHLLITAPILVIMDDSGRIKSGERHLKAGSELRLRCEARDVPERYNETVIWTRGDEILSEDVSENRTVEYMDGREIQVIVSTLLVERATPRHAGNYSCVVPEKAKTTVAVHVLNGELPAAVHDGNGVSGSVLNLWLIHLTVSYVFSR